jgi:signal transduction histidine kinase
MTGVFENLLSNAVKYSFPNTSITVCCHKLLPSQMHGSHQTADLLRAHHALSEPFVLISVSDEGQGLTEADMQKLFGRFQRLSARPTHGESSSGLGLSLVKEIVEMHGGKVWAESLGKDQGATFFVALPIVQE